MIFTLPEKARQVEIVICVAACYNLFMNLQTLAPQNYDAYFALRQALPGQLLRSGIFLAVTLIAGKG